MLVYVKAKTNASKNEVKQTGENKFEIKVREQPEKGKANAAIERVLAKYLRVPRSTVALKSGSTKRDKVFEVFN